MIDPDAASICLLSFEGPDRYALACGLGVRITHLAGTLAACGFGTRLNACFWIRSGSSSRGPRDSVP